jgi:hypothetical protein
MACPKSGIEQPFSPATIAERGRRETSTEARIAAIDVGRLLKFNQFIRELYG